MEESVRKDTSLKHIFRNKLFLGWKLTQSRVLYHDLVVNTCLQWGTQILSPYNHSSRKKSSSPSTLTILATSTNSSELQAVFILASVYKEILLHISLNKCYYLLAHFVSFSFSSDFPLIYTTLKQARQSAEVLKHK